MGTFHSIALQPPPLIKIFHVGRSHRHASSTPLEPSKDDDSSNSHTNKTSNKYVPYLEELARTNAAEAASSGGRIEVVIGGVGGAGGGVGGVRRSDDV